VKLGDLLAVKEGETLFVLVWSEDSCRVWCRDEVGIFLGEKVGDTIQVLMKGHVGWVAQQNVRTIEND
jgi:hypothetical protein